MDNNDSAQQGGNASQSLRNPDLLAYVDKLIDERGFSDLTPEVRAQLKKDLMVRLDDFMVGRMIAALSDADVVTFENMLKSEKPELEVQQFMEAHIPDFVNFISGVLVEFRMVYLGLVNSPVVDEVQPSSPPPAPVAPADSDRIGS